MPLKSLPLFEQSERVLRNKKPVIQSYIRSFVDEVNGNIISINKKIDEYQNANKKEKLELIDEIKTIIVHMDSISSEFVYVIPNFHKTIYQKLMSEIHAEAEILFSQDADTKKITTWEDFFWQMTVDEANEFSVLLEKNLDLSDMSNAIKSRPFSPSSIEFLSSKSLIRVGGLNSINYRAQSIDNGVAKQDYQLVKLENRVNLPRHAEVYLRNQGITDIFTNHSAPRKVFPEGISTIRPEERFLIQDDYLLGGDLSAYSERIEDIEEKLDEALQIYTQMSDILEKIEAFGCAHVDMKNSNWLIDIQSGHLKVSDTKGLIFINHEGMLLPQDPKNRTFLDLPTTITFNPPELQVHKNPISANKIHSYIMGLNLYQFLTSCSYDELIYRNFNHEVFNSSKGKSFEDLIERMLSDDPTLRPELAEVKQQLQRMSSPFFEISLEYPEHADVIVQANFEIEALFNALTHNEVEAISDAVMSVPPLQRMDILLPSNEGYPKAIDVHNLIKVAKMKTQCVEYLKDFELFCASNEISKPEDFDKWHQITQLEVMDMTHADTFKQLKKEIKATALAIKKEVTTKQFLDTKAQLSEIKDDVEKTKEQPEITRGNTNSPSS